MEVKFIISLIFSTLVAIFAVQNAGSVEINFLFTKTTVSQAVIILGSAIVGAIIVLLLGIVRQIKQSMKIKQLTKEIEKHIEEKSAIQTKLDENNFNNVEEQITEEYKKDIELNSEIEELSE